MIFTTLSHISSFISRKFITNDPQLSSSSRKNTCLKRLATSFPFYKWEKQAYSGYTFIMLPRLMP